MAKESEKLDIEDIVDPLDEADEKVEEAAAKKTEDVDLEEAVAEETDQKKEPEPEKGEKDSEGNKDVLEKAVADPKEDNKIDDSSVKTPDTGSATDSSQGSPASSSKAKPAKKPFPWKTVAIIVITFLVTAALILGGFFLYQKYGKKTETSSVQPTNDVTVNVTKPAATAKTVYVTAEPTLNLRKDPSSTAQILDHIPYGTQLTVLATQGTWYQVAYNNQTGWVDSTYTAAQNPLVYQNTDYRFQITFPAGWAGYKLSPIKADSSETAAWYVALPTTDKSHADSGVDAGYASMFALTVFTPQQWTEIQKLEGVKPTLAVQNQQWVIAYSLPNGTPPSDLTTQAAQTKSVVATIKFY